MFDSLFPEESAAKRNERQQLDHLLRVSAPHERMVLAGVGVALLAFAAWVLFGSIARSISAEGLLIKPGVRHEAAAVESGHLVEFLVAPGGRVAAGGPVARQSVPELEREIAALRERVAQLQARAEGAGGRETALRGLLDAARTALLHAEAQRAAKEIIVSPIDGEVMAWHPSVGDYVPSGAAVARIRAAEGPSLQAVLRVAPRIAQRMRPGLPASVEFEMPDGTPRRLDGEVAAVVAGPLPDWLAALPPGVGNAARRVDVALSGVEGLSLPDGTPCRIRVELGRHPLFALLVPGRL